MRLLLPLAWLYAAAMALRNRLFDLGVLRQTAFHLPVISVGNLAVGGTGKTPHTEYLLRLLLAEGKACAMLSRGYGRRTKGFQEVETHSTAAAVGDEPLQVKRSLPEVRVCVCEKRPEGIRRILSTGRQPDAILLDDAYQHRYVRPSLSILLTDYARPYSADHVLPAGRLRESRSGAKRADIILVTKCPDRLSAEARQSLGSRLKPLPRQHVFFTRMKYAALRPAFPDAAGLEVGPDSRVLLLTGIANPSGLVARLSERHAQVESISFADHHRFTSADIDRVARRAERFDAVVTTEKDAARLGGMNLPATLRRRLLVQPIEVEFLLPEEKEKFNLIITSHVAENQRNRRVD